MKRYTLTVERRADLIELASVAGIVCMHVTYLDPSCDWCDRGYLQDVKMLLGARHPKSDTDYQECLERVAAYLGWEEDE